MAGKEDTINFQECLAFYEKEQFMQQQYSTKTAENWDFFCNAEEIDSSVEYYIDLIKNSTFEYSGRTLEIESRTGLFAIALASRKYNTLAIESNLSFISVINRKLSGNSNIEISHDSINTFDTKEKFTGVVFSDVFQFFDERDQAFNVLEKVREMLNNKGIIFFVVSSAHELWNASGWSDTYTDEFKNGFSRRERTYYPINKLLGLAKVSDYRVTCVNEKYTFDLLSEIMRFYTLSEYKLMLDQAGFRNIRLEKSPSQAARPEGKRKNVYYISAVK